MADGDASVDLIDGEILDCGSISISYQVTGLAQISFTVYKPVDEGTPYSEGGPAFSMCAGGVQFTGWVTSQSLVPASDAEYNQWNVTATAVGCSIDEGCESTC